MPEPITITHERKQYTWDGQRWYGSDDWVVPTRGMMRFLDTLIADQIPVEKVPVKEKKKK
jgi:hypothetical protein